MTGVLPAGQCVCGRDIPTASPSDWACSEECQTAWMCHQANPDYPHPRDIRAAAEQALQARIARPARGGGAEQFSASLGTVAPGTEINVDGQQFVRVGGHWQPVGLWESAAGRFADAGRYRRWCPTCQARVDSLLYPASDRQQCTVCEAYWEGRPLLGAVESRGEPWPGHRLLLTDGQRSTTFGVSREAADRILLHGAGAHLTSWFNYQWLRLERQLGGGWADSDQPDERQQRRQRVRLRYGWHADVVS